MLKNKGKKEKLKMIVDCTTHLLCVEHKQFELAAEF